MYNPRALQKRKRNKKNYLTSINNRFDINDRKIDFALDSIKRYQNFFISSIISFAYLGVSYFCGHFPQDGGSEILKDPFIYTDMAAAIISVLTPVAIFPYKLSKKKLEKVIEDEKLILEDLSTRLNLESYKIHNSFHKKSRILHRNYINMTTI